MLRLDDVNVRVENKIQRQTDEFVSGVVLVVYDQQLVWAEVQLKLGEEEIYA